MSTVLCGSEEKVQTRATMLGHRSSQEIVNYTVQHDTRYTAQ